MLLTKRRFRRRLYIHWEKVNFLVSRKQIGVTRASSYASERTSLAVTQHSQRLFIRAVVTSFRTSQLVASSGCVLRNKHLFTF